MAADRHNRRQLYGHLGTERVPREPPQASTVTQHVLSGTLAHGVRADAAYTMAGLEIRVQLGPVFIVVRGRAAAASLRDLHRELAPVLEALFPDLAGELERQQRHRATLRNGGDPAALREASGG